MSTPQQPGADHVGVTLTLADEILSFDAILAAATDQAASASPGDENRYHTLLAPRFLTWSALFVLLDPYCCPVNIPPDDPGHYPIPEAKTAEEIALQKRSVDIVEAIVSKVHAAVRDMSSGLLSSPHPTRSEGEQDDKQRRLGMFCPLALDAVYCVMGLYCWLCQEGGDESFKSRLADIDGFLSAVGERWGLAKEYLSLKEYHDDAGQLGLAG